jgi:ribose/xylose/arabinose/galactoside ABC-type transport system permease subunit
MTALANDTGVRNVGHEAPLIFGGWEIDLFAIMALLYAAGLYLNPAFLGSTDALFSVLRDASRYGVLAIGMTFVIVNKELDLSVGSTFGLTVAIFGMIFAPTYFDMGVWTAVFWCLVMGLAIGLINGFMVTVLEVPAFIATLTMLFIGRGVILGLTGGKNIAFEIKGELSHVLPFGGDQLAWLQQSDHSLHHHRLSRSRGARLYDDRLDDLLCRRQRASRTLRWHQHAFRAHALLRSLISLRGDGGFDECRAEQGRGPAGRIWLGIDRHFIGDRWRGGHFWRQGPDSRLLPRRDSHRAHRQGSAQTIFVLLVALIAGIVLGYTTFGQKVYAIGGNERAANFAGVNTRRVRFTAFLISSTCAACAGIIYDAFYRSFIPTAGQLRELDSISSVIIGGGSIFGGYGMLIGSLAGAAAITLIRSLLSLQIILKDGSSFVLPQQWQNVFIGLILIAAVVGDIWLRQNNILGQWFGRRRAAEEGSAPVEPVTEAEA